MILDYTIVVPVYANSGSLQALYNTVVEDVFEKLPELSGGLVFVDDGSPDLSFEILKRLRDSDPKRVEVIKLSRNFGQASAILAGLQHSKSKCSIIMSADLQDPPSLILDMLKEHFDNQFEVVGAERVSREESFLRKIPGRIFFGLIRKLSFANMPIGGFDFVLIGARSRSFILAENAANPFWQGQMLWPGYPVKFLPYTRKERHSGKSMYSFSKKLKYFIDGIMGYSFAPIRGMSILGLFISLLGFGYAGFITVAKLMGWTTMTYGWAPIMISILVLSGFQMLMLGVIGEYLWRTMDEIRDRPRFLIDEELVNVFEDDLSQLKSSAP